ncbi:TRAP transporter small permease [Shimia sediminis]|uniref:TRAP transporter small permease n=1 Tax=Shimia sediminis TaxID=2497945 RepID=UPI000F8C95A3|nr:TRAP transporter small permease [Shimia sediminis]
MKHTIPKLLNASRHLSLQLATVLLFLDLLVILFGVITRYVIGGAPIWTDELARYLIIGGVMIAAGAVWVDGSHMRVNAIERLLSKKLCNILKVYQWLLILVIALLGTVFSYRYAFSVSFFKTQGLGVSRTIPLLTIPIGLGLLSWHLLLAGPWGASDQTEEIAE